MKFLIAILMINQILTQDIGQKMYKNEDTDSAIIYYKKLLKDKNLSEDDIVYNLATIYSSIDSLIKAKEYFDLANKDSLNPSSELSYNYGNMLYKSQDLEGSLKAYKQSLLKNPLDNDARKNYEFVKNEIEKNKQNQKKNQEMNDDSEDSENNENNNSDDGNQSNKNKDNKSNNTQQNPEKNNTDEGPTNQELSDSSEKQNNQQREINIDQSVENILNAMKENEKVNKKRKQKNYFNDSGKEW
ncbi:MAG: hypothetical protein ACJ0RN_00840 [Candidatus Neomarinimicrobiota bacterium]